MQPGVHSVSFGGIVVTVKSITPSGPFFEHRGEMSAPADSPSARAETDTSLDRRLDNYLVLSVVDESNVKIRREVRYGVARQEGGKVVADWTMTTILDRDRAPPTLLWETPGETRWFMVAFELHNIAVSSVTTK
jgi:predicted NUDIX family NTP pyrophosphohydrolase